MDWRESADWPAEGQTELPKSASCEDGCHVEHAGERVGVRAARLPGVLDPHAGHQQAHREVVRERLRMVIGKNAGSMVVKFFEVSEVHDVFEFVRQREPLRFSAVVIAERDHPVLPDPGGCAVNWQGGGVLDLDLGNRAYALNRHRRLFAAPGAQERVGLHFGVALLSRGRDRPIVRHDGSQASENASTSGHRSELFEVDGRWWDHHLRLFATSPWVRASLTAARPRHCVVRGDATAV